MGAFKSFFAVTFHSHRDIKSSLILQRNMIKDSKLDVGKKTLKFKKNLEEYTVTWVFLTCFTESVSPIPDKLQLIQRPLKVLSSLCFCNSLKRAGTLSS